MDIKVATVAEDLGGSSLWADGAEAVAWASRMKTAHSESRVFGKVSSGIVWTSDTGSDGKPLT